MSDILPKFKMYIFVSFLAILLNLGYNLMLAGYTESIDILVLLAGFGTAFVPFVSLISLVFNYSAIPVEALAMVGIFTTIISVVQVFLTAMFLLQTVHNIIWNPDV